jgi:UDP-3-O-[3-hydroxymyristoyl] N-acetylglucosamine deacetylase
VQLEKGIHMTIQQATLACPVKFAGVGLHSGCMVHVEIFPAAVNTGILFHRTDSAGAYPVLANPFNISETTLSTAIGHGPSRVSTIEHLMAAFAGLGVDNAYVRIDNGEVPILDGSAAPFVDQILIAGIVYQGAPKKFLVCKKAFEISSGDHLIRIEPFDGLSFSCSIDFTEMSPVIGKQSLLTIFDEKTFSKFSEARTFCHIKDVNFMRERGLAKGGSLDNAVVVDDHKVLNGEGLRFEDEFVRHKLLDCVGDLALLGGALRGKITLRKSGHALHSEFTKNILLNQQDYLEVYWGSPRPQVQLDRVAVSAVF